MKLPLDQVFVRLMIGVLANDCHGGSGALPSPGFGLAGALIGRLLFGAPMLGSHRV